MWIKIDLKYSYETEKQSFAENTENLQVDDVDITQVVLKGFFLDMPDLFFI